MTCFGNIECIENYVVLIKKRLSYIVGKEDIDHSKQNKELEMERAQLLNKLRECQGFVTYPEIATMNHN